MGDGADDRLNERRQLQEAKLLGYEKVRCPQCGMFTMVEHSMFTLECDLCGTLVSTNGPPQTGEFVRPKAARFICEEIDMVPQHSQDGC